MTFEELRQALIRLDELQDRVSQTDALRSGVGEEESERALVKVMGMVNPEHVTRKDIHNAIVDIEEQVPEFGVGYWKERATFVLVPKVSSLPTMLKRED